MLSYAVIPKRPATLIFLLASVRALSSYKPVPVIDRQNQFISISPPDGIKVSHSIIFLHGLGDTCFGWGSAMYEILEKLPGLRCVLPTASEMPVSLNGGELICLRSSKYLLSISLLCINSTASASRFFS